MGTRIKIFVVLMHLLIVSVNCDLKNLQNCAKHRACWQRLDQEIIDIIRDNIHNETQPCDNFWFYACGAWQPPSGTQHVDNFGIAIENYERQQQEFLETNFEVEVNENESTQHVTDLLSKLQTYHSSCKQVEIEMNDYLEEIGKRVRTNLPDWHAMLQNISSTRSENFYWLALIAELRRFGLNDVIFKERVSMAFDDARKYIIELGFPADDESFVNKNELVNYFIQFKLADGVTDKLWELAADIFELETQLKELRAKHMRNEVTDATFEKSLNVNELKLLAPNIDWHLYFSVLLQRQHVDEVLTIEINGIGYFKEVATLLEQTDERIVGLYIYMHLCKYLLEIRPRKQFNHCIDHMNVVLPLGMNFLYKYFLYDSYAQDEAALAAIFKKLKLQFSKYLLTNKLDLNLIEKTYLKEKADKMILRLGNLPRIADLEYYNHYYDSVNLKNNNFYHNHLEMLSFRFKEQHKAFAEKSKQFDFDAFYVNDDIVQLRSAPYFVHEQNLLIVPMVFLQLPFFHHGLSPLLQHSLVGFILGHEFNHAFEYEGIIMDALGNENAIGFEIRKKAKFRAGVKCFQQTPTQSLIERMADVNGFQLAFDAYFDAYFDDSNVEVKENVINDNDVDDNDDNVGAFKNARNSTFALEYEKAQRLYFLNFAQFFCGQLPEPIAHDRDDVRVNVVIKNMPEFQEVFQCDKQDDEQFTLCQMWR